MFKYLTQKGNSSYSFKILLFFFCTDQTLNNTSTKPHSQCVLFSLFSVGQIRIYLFGSNELNGFTEEMFTHILGVTSKL